MGAVHARAAGEGGRGVGWGGVGWGGVGAGQGHGWRGQGTWIPCGRRRTHPSMARRPVPSPQPPPTPTKSTQELDERGVAPELYPYGSRGPLGAHYLAAKYGVRWGDLGDD